MPRSLAAKLRRSMPEESTIDLDRHAEHIARIVFQARTAAVKRHAAAVHAWLASARHDAAADDSGRPAERQE